MVTLQPTRAFPQHRKVGPCLTRPAYRDGRRKTAVKVFTIATESAYLLLFGIPSINLDQQLKDRCRQIGPLQQITKLTDYPERERFTDVFLAKFDSVQTARRAKRKLDDTSFYGGSVHACYAPEYETVAETRIKLHTCRRDNARIARKTEHDYSQRLLGSAAPQDTLETSTPSIPLPDASAPNLNPDSTDTPSSSSIPLTSTDSFPIGSGDARDDARRYWLERGMDWMQLSLPAQSTPTVDTYSSTDHNANIGPNGKPLPLPVLQALSWRPYHAPESTQVHRPRSPEPPADLESKPKSSETSSFLPRCLRVRPSSEKISTETPDPVVKLSSQSPITVGELKRLAFTLGPEQGPQLPPVSSHAPRGSKHATKRIVFHGRPAKRRRDCDDKSNGSDLC